MTDLSKHAEAILCAVLQCDQGGLMDSYCDSPEHRAAILAALTDLFDAGARAMQESGCRLLRGTGEAAWLRAINPASLRTTE